MRTCDHPSPHGMELAYGATFRQEMAERHFAPCMHTLRALRHCPFALDVFLWDACYAARAPEAAAGVLAPDSILRARRPPLATPERERDPRLRARPRHGAREAPGH